MNGIVLKQSTAATVVIGPFVDSGDGVTAETGLTISQADIRLTKNGGAFAQTSAATGATHMENGYYSIPLSTTDTNTLGTLTVAVSESGALPRRLDFNVITANAWDTLCSTDTWDVNVTAMASGTITAAAIATGAIDADAIADSAIDAGAIATGAITAAKFAAGAIDAAAVAADAGTEIGAAAASAVWAPGTKAITAIGTGGITAASFAAGAIDATAIANAAIDAATFAAGAINAAAIADAAIDAATFAAGAIDAAAIANGAIDDATFATDARARMQTECQEALQAYNLDHLIQAAVDTNWGTTVQASSVIGMMASKDTGNTFDRSTDSNEALKDGSATVAAVAAAILAIPGNKLATNVTGQVEASTVAALGANVITAASIATDAGTELGTAVWATTTRQLTGTQTYNLTGNITGNLSGSVGSVTGAVGSVAANGIGTTAIADNALRPGCFATDSITARAIESGAIDASALATDAVDEIVDAVWNEDIATAHGTAATSGLMLRSLGSAISTRTNNATLNALLGVPDSASATVASKVTDDVWDEATSAHTTAGSTGKAIADAQSAGDPWATAIPGAYGAGTAGKILGDNVNATISSRAAETGGNISDIETIVTSTGVVLTAAGRNAILDTALSGHTSSGTVGEALANAGSAGDPWSTAVPGSYGAGTAGKILGDNLNATVSSRAPEAAGAVAAIKAKTDSLTFTSAGKVDATLQAAADMADAVASKVWTTPATRQLTGTQTFNVTGNITGNLSGTVGSVTGAVGSVTGAVGSVTGAVGSVTGNVGGNVAGSVGSVTGAVGSVTGNVGGNVVGSVASVTAGVTLANDAITSAKIEATGAAEIADAVWDEARSGHTGAGTFGEGTYALNLRPRKAVALPNFTFMMFDTNGAAVASLTPTVYVAKDSGSEAASANAVVEIGSGQYRVNLSSTEMNADIVRIRAHVASGADDTVLTIYTHL